jgi:BirA family biotin operon repressor/biotin-[acetyl-CoA-carboxylase] ligase
MMSSIAIPAILDRLAHVGVDGLPYPNSCQDHDELELCRSWHYRIECREGRARLEFDHDQLVPSWIVAETPAVAWEALRTEGYLEIGSTNECALRRARQGASAGTLVFAEAQTAGRGRLGRQWFAPPRGGLCFSLIVCPLTSSSRWPLLTHVASAALAFAIRELESEDMIPVPLDLELRWPNDVLISGKKAAGILLETVGTGSSLSAAVVGVGVNVAPGSLPPELQGSAISLSEAAGVRVPRRRLLVRFLYHFQLGYELFARGEHQAILERWKRFSRMWSDTPVWIMEGERTRPGVTAGLTDEGALRVRGADGAEEVILAGDVSIRRSQSGER